MNPRVKLVKVKSGWGNTSWDVLVDGVLVGNYRFRVDALRAGEARVARLAEEESSLGEYINDLWAGEPDE